MAWSYRKRINIAPGVRLNVSKKGVSSTFGVRGASITTGQNGTYLNTGIPGTGIYNRQKIGGSNRTKTNLPVPPNVSQKNSSAANGCGIFAIISIIIAAVFIISGEYEHPFLFYIGWLVGTIILGLIIFVFIPMITNSTSAKKVEQSIQTQIEKAQNALDQASHPIQREILQNFITCTELSRKIDETEAIIEALKKKIAKRSKPQLEEQLAKYEAETSKLTTELDKVQLNVDKDLDDTEKWNYSKFCESFEKLLSCKKTWIITLSMRETELKSSAANQVIRKEINFDTGVFNYIKSSFDIPMLRDLKGNIYYIYPRYIIKTQSFTDFEVFPIDTINLKYSKQTFIEDETVPEDSHVVNYTYRYINKNGGPDKRYAYNPRLPIVGYGKIEIEKFGLTYSVSDYSVADEFVNTYYNLLKSTSSNNNISKQTPEKQQDNHISEEYFLSITQEVEKIILLCENLCVDKSFLQVLENHNTIIDEKYTDIQQHIKTLFVMDMTMCFIDLGHSLNMKSKEGFGLFYFFARTNGLDKFEYDKLKSVLKSDLCDSVLEFFIKVQNAVEANKAIDELFMISEILGKYDTNQQKKYLVMLYRFASLTAKADGIVTEKESEWLSKLLKMSDFEDSPQQNEKYLIAEIKEFDESEYDPLFEEAALIVVQTQLGSASMLQRKLKLGYNRAGNIIDQLEIAGIVGAFTGAGSREVKIADERELELFLKNLKQSKPSYYIDEKPNKIKERTEKIHPILKSDSQDELQSLIGLTSVKTEILTLTNFIKIQQQRQSKGLKTSQPSYHCVFTGNPGTGKTTVARIVAEIYKELGILNNGHLVETDRSGLVAEYVGQTAVKTNKIIDSALDGVLFIDEAYSLVSGGDNDYGKEAIATLLKRMEDNRDRLVVILAGYSKEMQTFIDSNPGLQSRFNRYIDFPDYSAEELYQIFELNLKRFDYKISTDATTPLQEYLVKAVANKDKHFGNARFVRNLFEKTIEQQANRLSKEVNLTHDILSEIRAVDIPM